MKTHFAFRLPLALISAMVAASLAGATPAAAQTVTTDQSDYPPGSIVTITGAGWAPNETVTMAEPDPVGFHARLAKNDRDKILGGNATRLLGIT